jgi:hypothetical protein
MLTAYHKSNRFLLIASAFCMLSLSGGAYKVYQSWNQIRHYSSAHELEQAGKLIEAEEQYRLAADYRTLSYKTQETDESLHNLKPVSEIKAIIEELDKRVRSSDENRNVQELTKAYQEYESKKSGYGKPGDEFSAKIFADASGYFEIEEHLTEAFSDHKKRLLKNLQSKVDKKTKGEEQDIADLLTIVAVYEQHAPEKSGEVLELVKKSDQLYMDALIKDKGFDDVLKETVPLLVRYQTYGADPAWLITKIDEYAGSRLKKAADEGKAEEFAAMAASFAANKDFARSGSPVNGIIQQGVSAISARAAQLAASGSYQESIGLYKKLSAYADMSAAVKEIEIRWLENDPGQLLGKAASGKTFTSIIGGRATAGGKAAAAGLTDGRKLGLASLSDNGGTSYEEGSLDANVKIRSLKFAPNLSVQGEAVVLLDAESAAGKAHRYMAFEATGSGLRKILDVDADSYTVEQPGTLLVNNITGEGAGQQSFFDFKGGKYAFTRVKPDYIEIALSELPNYRNVKVRLTCTILASDGKTAVVSFNNEYLLLQGDFSFKTGTAVVTGKWSSTDTVKKGAQSINAYVMNVTAVTQ